MEPPPIVDGVAVIRLAGGRANAMTAEFLVTIERQFDALEASEAAAAVVTGYERFFSAGLALPALVGLDRARMKAFIERFDAVMLRVYACPLPVVAAVNGHAIAGGCVLAMQADARVMADADARIGLNEAQLGIGLPAIVIETLRVLVPAASLAEIALEGRLFTPHEALELGLVDEVIAPAALEARAVSRAKQLASSPASAYAMIKAAVRRPVIEAIARANPAQTERWLDTWFSPAAQARIAEAVARLARPR